MVAAGQPPGGGASAEPEIEYVDVDGTPIRVALRPGLGTPLLLCNGIGANLELTFPLLEALGDLEIIAFDLPGTGRSGMWLRPRRFSGIARMTSRLLDRLGYRRVDVAGVSWGGALAQQFARQFPERCRRLVLAATSAGAVMIPGAPAAVARVLTSRRYQSRRYMRRAAPHIYGGEVRRHPELVTQHIERLIPPRRLGYIYQMLAGLGWTSIHWLHRLRQPTLLLAGAGDPLVPPVNARLMAKLIPDNRVHIVPGGGHLFMLYQAEEVAPVIREFLCAPDAKLRDNLPATG